MPHTHYSERQVHRQLARVRRRMGERLRTTSALALGLGQPRVAGSTKDPLKRIARRYRKG